MNNICQLCECVLISRYSSRKYCADCSKKVDHKHKNRWRRENREKEQIQQNNYRKKMKGNPHYKEVLYKQYKTFLARYPERWMARSKVKSAVKTGKLKRVKDCLCFDCGKPAKEYDHYEGYNEENWLNVQAVCIPCHKKRTIGGNK